MILVVLPSLSGGGAQRAAAWLSQAWSHEQRVVVAVFDATGATYFSGREVFDLGAGASRGSLGKFFTGIRRVFLLRRLFRTLRPDHAFGFMESANIPLVLAALSCGARSRTVVSVRCNPDHIQWFHKALARVLYPLADEVAVVSRGAADRLVRGLSLSPRNVRVRYSPLPLQTIRSLASRTDSVSASLSRFIGSYFFTAGRLVPGKDFAGMIRIFASLENPSIRLVIAGEGPERAPLEALIAHKGLSNRILLLGQLENPFPLMKNALAFLLTSQHEGFPMVLLESMACGCPIVAFDCDFGPAEAVAETGAGFVVPLGDTAAFAASMERLAADATLRNAMSVAAEIRADDFEATKIAASWLSR